MTTAVPTNNFQTITVTSQYPATPLVWPEGLMVNLRNLDANNTVYLGSDQGILAGDVNHTVPLAPSGSYVAGGKVPVYGICLSGKTAQVARTPDSVNFFLPPNLAQLGGAQVFVQATAPTGTIPLNSIWFNTTLNALEYWNGSAWIIQAFAGNQLITAGTIVANLMAAGIVVGGIVDGTTIKAQTFVGGNYFGYSTATAQQDKLICSIVPGTVSVSDGVGNTALAGITVYGGIANQWQAFGMVGSGLGFGFGIAWYQSTNAHMTAWTQQGGFNTVFGAQTQITNNGQGFLFGSNLVNEALTIDGSISMNGGLTITGTGQISLPAGQGPFVSGETFHSITLAAGLSGTMRIKKVPWNMVFIEVLVSWTATVATTFTCGNLPDSTYYPTVNDPGGNRLLDMGSNAAWTTDTQARVFVPSSGALQVVVGASTAGGNGCYQGFYATN